MTYDDKEHRRKWFDHTCPECEATNVTPIEKQARGREDWCKYICEDCKHEFGPVMYAKSY